MNGRSARPAGGAHDGTARPAGGVRRRWRLVLARGETAPESVRRFAVRARRRRWRAALPWLVAAGMVAVVAASWGVIGFTGLFGVRHIEVTGATITAVEDVRSAADVPAGSPLARVDTAAVRMRVERVAPVRSATVTRRWPDTLVVRVEERVAAAAVPLPDGTGFVAVDQTGVAFQTLAQYPGGMPVVRVASPSASDATTRAALTVLRSLPQDLRAPLGALVADAPARIRLELTDGRVIVWGDATENETKARVALVLLGRPGRVLDVSAPNLVTVR